MSGTSSLLARQGEELAVMVGVHLEEEIHELGSSEGHHGAQLSTNKTESTLGAHHVDERWCQSSKRPGEPSLPYELAFDLAQPLP